MLNWPFCLRPVMHFSSEDSFPQEPSWLEPVKEESMEGESRAKYCLERIHIHLEFFEAVRTVPYGCSFMCAARSHLQQKGGLAWSVVSQEMDLPRALVWNRFFSFVYGTKKRNGESGELCLTGRTAEHMLYLLINALKMATDGNVLHLSEQLQNQSTYPDLHFK